MIYPALALLEFSSIATGIQAGDAMVKKAPVEKIQSGTVQPGHYLVLVTGDVASVEEAVNAGRETGQDSLRGVIFLPNVHPGVVEGINGNRPEITADAGAVALGVVETETVAAVIGAADAGLKGAEVILWQLRLADGLGGKGLALFRGLVADVEAAVEIAATHSASQLVRQVVIPQLHPEMQENIVMDGRFGTHYGREE
jgi:microcompartment protein CcmL/EutN